MAPKLKLEPVARIVYLEDVKASISFADKLRGMWLGSAPQVERSPNDPAAILFTSGSEGLPKGVVLSHMNMLANAMQSLNRVAVNGQDKVFNVLPVFHSFGLTAGLIMPLVAGVPVFLYPTPLHYRIVPELVYQTNATILFGTGIGTAFLLFMANRRGEIGGIAFATRHVVLADRLFTAPAALVQPATGLAMAGLGGHELSEPWLLWSLALYVFAGGCWLPVLWIQVRMRNLAGQALADRAKLPPLYWRLDRWWIALGSLAFPAILAVVYLMVFKPA